MKKSRVQKIAKIVSVILILAILGGTALAKVSGNSRSEDYKDLMYNLDSAVQSIKLKNDPSSHLSRSRNLYESLVTEEYENRDFGDDQDLKSLDNSIRQRFASYATAWQSYSVRASRIKTMYQVGQIKKSRYHSLIDQYRKSAIETAPVGKIKDLRSDISKLSEDLKVGLSATFEYSALMILLLSLSIAFWATEFCRKIVSWERIEDAKDKINGWKDKMKEIQQSKSKKKRKLEAQTEEFEEGQEVAWTETVKQGGVYLGFFFLIAIYLGWVYGEWIVAWLPFNFLSSVSIFGISLGFFAWFLFTFLGFSQVWRFVLVPDDS